eukprot:421102-Pyramimonas_sp.AAC.1
MRWLGVTPCRIISPPNRSTLALREELHMCHTCRALRHTGSHTCVTPEMIRALPEVVADAAATPPPDR